jgi:hypothetical protein
MCVDFLLDYETLNAPQHDQHAPNHIYMPRVLEDSEVVYFYLPALGEAVFVRQIAGLALYSLLTAAMQRRTHQQEPRHPFLDGRQSWVILDEFHELTGTSFEKVLVESRKYGLGLILANQSNAQLRHQDTDLSGIVFQGTSVQQYFTVDEDDLRMVQRMSGETDVLRQTISEGRVNTVSATWAREPALDTNIILEANGKRGDCLVRIIDGQGAAHFRRAATLFPFTLWQYSVSQDKPLPQKERGEPSQPMTEVRQSDPQQESPADDELQSRARELWKRYHAERGQGAPPPQMNPKQRKDRRNRAKPGP